jgi:hypothetical protein
LGKLCFLQWANLLVEWHVNLHKCVAWSPYDFLVNFTTPSSFNIPSKGIKVLGIPIVIFSFISFLIKLFVKRHYTCKFAS